MPMCASQISAELDAHVAPGQDAAGGERDRQRLEVGDVVGDGAHARPEEIAEPAEVRRQQQDEEQPPLVAGVDVESDGGREHGDALDPQEDGRETIDHRGAAYACELPNRQHGGAADRAGAQAVERELGLGEREHLDGRRHRMLADGLEQLVAVARG